MAYTPLKVSIADPCHEDWNGMVAVSGSTARHCDSCEKNVVDFTGMTDAQMHDYVRNNGGKICGRLRPDQLERPLRAVSTPGRNPLKVAATAAGLLIASAGLDAQTVPPPPPVPTEQTRAEPEIMGEIEPIELMGDISIAYDSTAMTHDTPPAPPPPPAPPVGSTTITPVADTLPIPPPPTVPACPPDPMIMGRMIISPPRPTGMDWVRDTLKNVLTPAPPPPEKPSLPPRPRPETPKYLDEVKVFPNPFVGRLNVALHLPEAQTIGLDLLDAAGRIVHAERRAATAGDNRFALEPDRNALTASLYYLRVTDAAGHVSTRPVIRAAGSFQTP